MLDKEKYILVSDNCPACEKLKEKFSDKLEKKEIGIIDATSELGKELIKKLDIRRVPKLILVNEEEK